MADGERLQFTTELDIKPVIAQAKELGAKVNEAIKKGSSSSDPILKKTGELLQKQTIAMRQQNALISKQERYEKNIAGINKQKADLAAKYVEREEKIQALALAEKEVSKRKIAAEGLYSGRTDSHAIKNQALLENAQANVVRLSKEISQSDAEINKMVESIQKGESSIINMENRANDFVQTWKIAEDLATTMQSAIGTNATEYFSILEAYVEKASSGANLFETSISKAGQSASSIFEEVKDNLTGLSTTAKESIADAESLFTGLEQDGFNLDADMSKMDISELTRYKDQLVEITKSIRQVWKEGYTGTAFNETFAKATEQIIKANQELNKFQSATKKGVNWTIVPDLKLDVSKMGSAELDKYSAQLKNRLKIISDAGIPDSLKEEYEQLKQKIVEVDLKQKQLNADIKGQMSQPIDINIDPSKMSLLELIQFIKTAKKEKAALEAKTDDTPEDSQRYNDLINALKQAMEEKKKLEAPLKDIDTTQMLGSINNIIQGATSANNMLEGVINTLKALGPIMQATGEAGAAALAEATAGLSIILTVITTVINALNSLKEKIVEIANKIWNTIKSVASKILNAVKQITKAITTLISKLKTGLQKAFDSVGKSSENAFSVKNLRRALQMLSKYVFGFRSFFFLYRKLRSAIKEGLENLVQFNDGANLTNTAITELRTSLLYLKNAWAAAFAPIINAVYPILVQFLDLLATVGNAIARFIAALTGQEVVIQAVRVNAEDYADTLKAAGGSAGSAAKKQEELNDRLAEFDDLNVLGRDKDNTTPSGSGGGGGGGDLLPNVADMFEQIETPVNKFAETLRKLWEEKDFYGIGNFIGTELSSGMQQLAKRLSPGGDIYEKGMEVAQHISDLIDGFLDVDDLGTSFGELFGRAVVFGIDILDTIITPDKFYKLGTQLADAMNRAIPMILPKLGQFFANLISSALAGWYGWVTEADFKKWGSSLATGFNNFLDSMKQVKVKGVLGKNSELNGWEMLGFNIQQTAQGLIDALGEAISGTDWHSLGEGIGDVLSQIDFGELWSGITGIGQKGKGALSDLWSGFSDKAPTGIVDVLQPLVTVLRELPGLLNTIKGVLENIFNPNGDTPEKQMARITGFITSLPERIEQLFDVLENLVEVLGDIASVLQTVFGTVGKATTKLHEFNDARRDFEDNHPILSRGAEVLTDVVGGPFAAFANIGTHIVDDVVGGVENALSGENPFEPLKDRAMEAVSMISPLGNLLSNVFSGYEAQMPGVHESLQTMILDMANIKEGATESLKGIPDTFTQIKGAADTQSTEMKNKFTSSFEAIKQSSGDSSKIVEEKFTLASDNIKTSFIGAWDEIKGAISEGGSLFMGLSDGLGNTIKSLLNAMITGINLSITKPLQELTISFNKLRMLDVDGAKPFATMPYLKIPTIPYLAQGAVIPPNKEFMAVLGDQSHGTNIEAPLDTIRQAVGEEFAPYSEAIVSAIEQLIRVVDEKNLTIGDREIGKANARYVQTQKLVKGTML